MNYNKLMWTVCHDGACIFQYVKNNFQGNKLFTEISMFLSKQANTVHNWLTENNYISSLGIHYKILFLYLSREYS